MKFNKIFIASHNRGKIKEFSDMLEPLGIKILSPSDLPIEEPKETGSTFQENSAIKSLSASNVLKMPVLADDSGLCVDALGGKPGVYTARYGGYNKLLLEMAQIPTNLRGAKFVCCIAFSAPNMPTQFFTGESIGSISQEAKNGENGFGFDPIFIPKNSTKTYSQMSAKEKAKTSHRKQALNKFLTYIKSQNAL